MGSKLAKAQVNNYEEMCLQHLSPLLYAACKREEMFNQYLHQFHFRETFEESLWIECSSTFFDVTGQLQDATVSIFQESRISLREFVYSDHRLVKVLQHPIGYSQLSSRVTEIEFDNTVVEQGLMSTLRNQHAVFHSTRTWEPPFRPTPTQYVETQLLAAIDKIVHDQTDGLIESLQTNLTTSPQIATIACQMIFQKNVFAPTLMQYMQKHLEEILSPIRRMCLVSYLDEQTRKTCDRLQKTKDTPITDVDEFSDILSWQFVTWLSFRCKHPSVTHYPKYSEGMAKQDGRVLMSIIRIIEKTPEVLLPDLERSIARALRLFDCDALSQPAKLAQLIQQVKNKIDALLPAMLQEVVCDRAKIEEALEQYIIFIKKLVVRINRALDGLTYNYRNERWRYPCEKPESNLVVIRGNIKGAFFDTIRTATFSFSKLDDVFLPPMPHGKGEYHLENCALLAMQLIARFLSDYDLGRVACVSRQLRDKVTKVRTVTATEEQFEKNFWLAENQANFNQLVIASADSVPAFYQLRLINAMLNILTNTLQPALTLDAVTKPIYIAAMTLLLSLVNAGNETATTHFNLLTQKELHLTLYRQVETMRQLNRNGVPASCFWAHRNDPFKMVERLVQYQPNRL